MMPTLRLTPALHDEYQTLFDTIDIHPTDEGIVDQKAWLLKYHLDRYYQVGVEAHVPGEFVGLAHIMESGSDFNRHLHNGDPLTARTTHVPAGRPKKGTPPFQWEESAIDALRGGRYDDGRPRSIPRLLWWLERYNGWGYRRYHAGTLSPYLWAKSQHYTRGKYAADGQFSETLVSRQVGAAVIFRRFLELFPDSAPAWVGSAPARVTPDEDSSPWCYESALGAPTRSLQRGLNALPGVFLKADGHAGPMTSEAFRKATGSYLKGDPRAT